MAHDDFYWGPLARGIFIMLLWCTLLVGRFYPMHLMWYVPMLIFLSLFLRPLLIRTGLHHIFSVLAAKPGDYIWEKRTRKRRAEVERRERDKRYRYRREKDPRLPKNW